MIHFVKVPIAVEHDQTATVEYWSTDHIVEVVPTIFVLNPNTRPATTTDQACVLYGHGYGERGRRIYVTIAETAANFVVRASAASRGVGCACCTPEPEPEPKKETNTKAE